MQYRRDVDGLRALAIIPVVLYHAGVAGIPGGFTGVDVFFVISGYLIAGLIISDLESGRFSLAGFYERRVRRIFPALFATILVASVFAWLLLPPRDMADFGASVAATSVFGSNLLFAAQSGYFSAPAEFKPLLHTWSLGVEEQFYLVFPVLAILLWRRGRQALGWTVIGAALVSFFASIHYVLSHPNAAFYLGPWRAWELSLGVLAALGIFPAPRSRWMHETCGWLGLLLICFGVASISRSDPFPGWNALFPCIGALLLILSGSWGSTQTSRILASRALVFVGLISYSLYLWHWPIIVFTKRYVLRQLDWPEIVGVIVLSVATAVASWRYVERPFRRRMDGTAASGRHVLHGAGYTIAIAFLMGASTWYSQGWPSRFDGSSTTKIRGREDYRPGSCFLEENQGFSDWARTGPCFIDHRAGKTILIWGDSFAAHYIPGLERSPDAKSYNFLQYSAFSCPPVPGAQVPWAPQCGDVNDNIQLVLDSHHVDAVVLVARWERYWNRHVDASSLGRSVAAIKARGLPVLLVGQGPSFAFSDPVEFVRRSGAVVAQSRDAGEINRQILGLVRPTEYFDPIAAMCPAGPCPLQVNGQFLYWDDGHYSTAGSTVASPGLIHALDVLLESEPPARP